MNKQIVQIVCATILMMSCSKNETTPPQASIEYLNLNNTVVTANDVLDIDLDKDGSYDFMVTKELSQTTGGQADLLEFRVFSRGQNQILMRSDRTPARKEEGVLIQKDDEPPFLWDRLNSTAIVSRVITADVATSYWQGAWMNQQNKYLPVQLLKDGKYHIGWIQISFNNVLPARIIVHDAAYNKIAEGPIKAGQK